MGADTANGSDPTSTSQEWDDDSPVTIILSHNERDLWRESDRAARNHSTDEEITRKYERGEFRIVTESNREKLPNFVQALRVPGYMQIRPFYQRRLRWNATRQSQLIESFIINVPVPPIFLYEKSPNSYEVMDGQQRITAIQSFYGNTLVLKGLQLWPELNGRTYASLPPSVKSGIDRRSISSIVLLTESSKSEEEANLIKRLVFERLNTGGVRLASQEIRNALYQSEFNDLVLDLSREDAFADAWNVPRRTSQERENPSQELLRNTMYEDMEDAELVLRFFALRHVEHFRRGMQGFLDLYMAEAVRFDNADLLFLRDLFLRTLHLASAIYREEVFRIWEPDKWAWSRRGRQAFYDAVMVGLSNHLDKSEPLIELREVIIERTKGLFVDHADGTFTGRGNTKSDIARRIRLYSKMIDDVLSGA